MTQTVRVDAAKYASAMAHLARTQPDVAAELRAAVITGPAPGDVLGVGSPQPEGITRVADSDLDTWVLQGDEWRTELGDLVLTWGELLRHYGPVTVLR